MWLAVDPPGRPERSLGSVIATATAGPLRHGFGPVRDHVLGCTVATGDGRLVKAGDDPLTEPLASQIRSLVALRDARYVILPAILRFENRDAGARGSLLLYLIDTRTSRIRWSGEVASDVSRNFSAAIAGSLAERLADLVVAR